MGKVTIEMTTQECGPNGNFSPGEERVVEEEVAEQYVEAGYARYPDLPPPPVKKRAAATRRGGRKRAEG